MAAFRLSPAAQRDLDAIFDYTLEQWGLAQAEAYLMALRNEVGETALHPERGTDFVIRGRIYRRVRSGAHFIWYTVAPVEITIIRVLHRVMDSPRHLAR
jgi:toxin ParE1/3/4